MKQFRFLLMAFFGAMSLFSISCNNEESTATDEKTGDTTATTAAVPEPVAPAAPQNFMIVIHKVKDYAKWQVAYEAADSMREANGMHKFLIGRGVSEPNMVVVASRADDIEKAKAVAKSDDLKKRMDKAGVIGAPAIKVYTVPVLNTASSSDLRVMSTLKVKDWDTWKTAYETGKQFRLDNGVEDRAYGHEVDDNHNVVVVVSILDSAKAVAYYKSDSLKKRMEASGVASAPKRFWYRVAKVY
jgi:hypothetical protein